MPDISLTNITSVAAVSIALSVVAAFLIHWLLYAIAVRVVRVIIRLSPCWTKWSCRRGPKRGALARSICRDAATCK